MNPFNHLPNITALPNPATGNAIVFAPFPPHGKGPLYTDLTPYEDDRRILRNPHKGWYWHYIDNGYKRDNYRVHHDHSDRLTDFPGLNHLYLRFDWGDIEKEEGVYDWSYIDSIMEDWAKYDYRFSLRLVTYEGDGSIPYATPEYVFKAGAKGYALPGNRLEPDYGDPVFLEKLERFLEEAGRKFNGNPLIELVDVGTFGTWGEGHTGNGTDVIYPAEVLKKHIDLHVKYFPDSFVILNDDHINHRWNRSYEENMALIDYAASLGLGLDDDSVCVRYYAENGPSYNSLRTPWLFDRFSGNAPIVLEFEHYQSVAPEVFKGGFPFLDAMQRTHATFAGFHGYPRPWLDREPWLSEFCANRLGYWYFLNGLETGTLLRGAKNRITLYGENRGYAKSYRKYDLKLMLRGDGGTFIQTVDADNRLWQPGEAFCVQTAFTPAGTLAAGTYMLSAGLFEGDRPIEFGIKKSRINEYGMADLAAVEVK